MVAKRQFKAVTWNVYMGTQVKVLRPIAKKLVTDNVSLFLMQEAGGSDITEMLKDLGLETFVYEQWRLAWNPKIWDASNVHPRRLSDVVVDAKDPNAMGWCAIGKFTHKPSKLDLKALSYHTPSHVQRPEWNENAPNRWRSLQEQMEAMVRLARGSRIKYHLYGGDDNVDEDDGKAPRWNFMLRTDPLRQIQAPKPTHAGGRQIDDFRVAGLKTVGPGSVRVGGGDHKLFIQEFEFVI